MDYFGIYLHIPYCNSRCSYCDFATEVLRRDNELSLYADALIKEIESYKRRNARLEVIADTVYFGGGTPSLLPIKDLKRILDLLKNVFIIGESAEITLEINPGTVDAEYLTELREIGINRASFGVQTFDNRHLKLLARSHTSSDAIETYRMLRNAGFQNISFDLIAGLPEQSIKDIEKNLDIVLSLCPEHVSVYLLEIHEGTPLADQLASGRRPKPDEDLAAEMYLKISNGLTAAGYEHYEISNFAREGFRSRHNLKYWTLQPYIGFGVSAHSFDGKRRWANERDTKIYIEKVISGLDPISQYYPVDPDKEKIFLGLRLMEGISLADISKENGFKKIILENEIEELVSLGLLEKDALTIKLTEKGRLYSNEVISRFI